MTDRLKQQLRELVDRQDIRLPKDRIQRYRWLIDLATEAAKLGAEEERDACAIQVEEADLPLADDGTSLSDLAIAIRERGAP